jgi:hypothetical protein
MHFSRLEIVLLMDLGSYVGPTFNFTKPSPARLEALHRFEREGLIRRNSPDAKWGDGDRDERPRVLTPRGDALSVLVMNPDITF